MVWLRIEPLLKDLLDLPEVKPESPRETDSLAKQIKSACDRSIDQVFTLFGWDEEFLAQENAPETIDRPTDERQWVLCIDDDPDVTLSLKLRLQQHGVEAVRAFAGMEGYRTAFLSPPAAITLDYEMPDGQGDYVLGRLKENPVTKDIPVIVLTGRKEKSLERKMLALGAADFLTKPYDWNQLWDTLAPHLAAPTVVNAI